MGVYCNQKLFTQDFDRVFINIQYYLMVIESLAREWDVDQR